MTVVAVLGLGEAGSLLAADLVAAGAEVRGYDPGPGRDVPGLTRTASAAAAVAGSDLVLSVNSAAVALAAAQAALPGFRPRRVYADLNTASPELKRELAELVAGTGARFADVALLGPVPAARPADAGARVGRRRAGVSPTCSGRSGMPVEVVSEQPGDAAALKLLRSVFMKGVAAAAIESLDAAEAAGEAEWLQRRDRRGDRRAAPRAVARGQPHATRRGGVEEMAAARELLRRARRRAADRDGDGGRTRRPRGDHACLESSWRRRRPT